MRNRDISEGALSPELENKNRNYDMQWAESLLSDCTLCPRHCHVNRLLGQAGYCGQTTLKAARASLHMWEEPVISGENGSGAIFFSGCSLRCVFCQNYDISHDGFGKSISEERFIDIMKELVSKGAHNINLVNPTHFVPFIRGALEKYKPPVPVVYNTGGYDRVESIKSLDGLVDIYLPDLKYYDADVSAKYSAAPDYFEKASEAVLEMRRQTETDMFKDGLMQRGLIIRHLVLPGNTAQSVKILKWISEKLPCDTFVSIMSQYTPCGEAFKYKDLRRKIVSAEYDKVINTFFDLGLKNGFMQEKTAAKTVFIPKFDLTGV